MLIFWFVILHGFVCRYQHFGGTYCHFLTLKIVCSSKMLLFACKSERRYNSDDQHRWCYSSLQWGQLSYTCIQTPCSHGLYRSRSPFRYRSKWAYSCSSHLCPGESFACMSNSKTFQIKWGRGSLLLPVLEIQSICLVACTKVFCLQLWVIWNKVMNQWDFRFYEGDSLVGYDNV
jgi:hypothetical protein